ncbi:MAG: pheA2 [Clostridia bacterium]|nr:pheA2 [Clostridia bacterium]
MENSDLNKLKALRDEIDNTDRQLIEYFEKRAEISKKIGILKQNSGNPVRDPEREQLVIKERSSWLKDSSLSYEAEAFIRAVISGSRRLQHSEYYRLNVDITPMDSPDYTKAVAYQGISGSYGEQAALFFTKGDEKKLYSCTYFEDVFKTVSANDCYGIVPIENSIIGGVSEVMDLFKQYECKIVKEIRVSEKHCLLGIKGTSLSDIKTIYSHPQAIEQCRDFIQKNNMKTISCHNTAQCTKTISNINDRTCATIASKRAAQLYNLDILAFNIQNNVNNITRFAVISKRQEVYPYSDKVSIAFCLPNESGSLCNALAYFQKYKLNLSKIESHPGKSEQWAYNFHIDFEGNYYDKNTIAALSALAEEAKEFTVLGFYGAEDSGEL